jgi:hypothetical protein
MRLNLDAIAEQKGKLDHVTSRLAHLDFTLQEAQSTIRTLQHERELAEHVERSIAELRARTRSTEPGLPDH